MDGLLIRFRLQSRGAGPPGHGSYGPPQGPNGPCCERRERGSSKADGLITAAVPAEPGRCAMYWNGHGMGAWGWFAMSFTQLIIWH